MSRTIEAKAIISAADATGGVFDKIAQKIKGVEKTAKSLGNIQAPKFTGNMMEELRRLKLTEKELQGVRGSLANYDAALRAARPSFSQFARAHEDFATKTVSHWRNVKSGIDEAALAQKKYDGLTKKMLAGAGAMALRGAAFMGGAYGAYRVGKAGVTAAATAQREGARDYLAGMTPEESRRIEDKAKETSRRFQSVDANTMHERLRDTAMSMRSTDKAVEMAETIGQMTTVLQSLKGKDKAVEEGRKFFTALDVLGKNIDPKEVRELADGFIKAQGVEGADMNLGGVMTMARRMKSAGATVSNRFLYTTGVGLARDMGDDRAGNALAMMMQQEAQATKQAKAYGQQYGLRDKSGQFVDRSTMMRDPDQWAWTNVSAAMRRAKLDPTKAEDVNTFLQSAYSNSSARDVLSKLMTQREQYEAKGPQFGRAPGLEAAGQLPSRDAFVAFEAVQAQLRNLASQKDTMDAAAKGLNQLSTAISQLGDAMEKGGWIKKAMDFASEKFAKESRDLEALKKVGEKVMEFDRASSTPGGLLNYFRGDPSKPDYPAAEDPMGADYSRRSFHSKDYWTGLGREGASASSAARLRAEAERNVPGFSSPGVSQTMTWGTGVQNQSSVEKSANVQVEGEVHGEMEGTFKFVVDSSGLVTAVDEMKRLSADIAGKLRSIGGNGPGSTGRSSPDAQAPGGSGYSGVW